MNALFELKAKRIQDGKIRCCEVATPPP